MKERREKPLYLVAVIFALAAALAVVCVLLNDGARDISHQVQALNNNAQAVEMDFSKLQEINNSEAVITDEQITVTFKEKDCRLTAVYNNDMELVSIKLQDVRVGKNIEAIVIVVAVLSVLAGITGYVFACVANSIVYKMKKDNRVKITKRKQ